jgi:thiamine kinase-like enzyme
MGAVPSVEDVLRRVSMFSGRAVSHRRLPGGLSHQIWVVTCGGRTYALRVLDPAVSAVGLGIPPAQEISNTLRAAESGVGARVYEVLPDVPALLLEFLPGRTLHAPDVHAPATAVRIAEACRRLHAGPAYGNDFNILVKLHELLAICREHDLRIPAGYTDRLSLVEEIGAVLAVAPPPLVPCHNDLLPENFIDSGGIIRIVDYQLSGNNDPCFELGDIAAEADLDPDRTGALAAAYFGDALTPALLARVRLNLALSNVTWTLWFSVHHGLLRSTRPASEEPAFDYWQEASDKWGRATRDLDSAELPGLLSAAAGHLPRRTPGAAVLHDTPTAT